MDEHRKPEGTESRPRMPANILVARSVGIVCIAAGFVAGMQGLEERESFWLPTALGLIVTGMLAQAYAFVCLLRRRLGK